MAISLPLYLKLGLTEVELKLRRLHSYKIVFPEKTPHYEERNFLVYLNMVPIPSTCQSLRFFSNIHSEDLIEILEVKLTEVWEASYDQVPIVFNSQSCIHIASNTCQLLSYFPALVLVLVGIPAHGFLFW